MVGPSYTCGRCGKEVLREGSCQNCGSTDKSVSVTPLSATAQSHANSPGIVAERNLGENREISVRSPHGTNSEARLSPNSISLNSEGRPDVGRPSEGNVQHILLRAMLNAGIKVEPKDGAEDHRGEDGLLEIDSRAFTLQITAVPHSTEYWRESNRGAAEFIGGLTDASALVRGAILAKTHLSLETRRQTILALDARHASVVNDVRVIEQYFLAYGSPVAEFEFADVWIVGPTPAHTRRLEHPTS